MSLFATLLLLAQLPSTPIHSHPLPSRAMGEAWPACRSTRDCWPKLRRCGPQTAGTENPIWPGWDLRETPLLFYFPNQEEVLINHPDPPAGFVPYSGPLSGPGWEIAVHRGSTILGIDGQNTSMEVAGIPTLVVADTLSNPRPNLLRWMRGSGSDIEKEDALTYSMLSADPYDQLGMILHEAFHVFQESWGAHKRGNEMALLGYPCLSVQNNVGFALEARALSDALTATD